MSIIDNLPFVGKDERVRKFLLPVRVAEVQGSVTDEDKLLEKKELQIDLREPSVTRLSTENGTGTASVTLDFGVELHGGLRLLIAYCKCAEKYPLIRITFGESLSETESAVGCDTSTNDHAIRQFTVPATSLSDQTWGETGFRFVKIELLTENASMTVKSAVAAFVYRELPYVGSFTCDDETVNKIYDTAAYTCHLCMQNMLWDGIKRDRLVWIGDMMVEAKTVLDVFGDKKLICDSLDFVRRRTPVTEWMNGMPAYSLWWIMIVKEIYFVTGDRSFLNDQHDYLTALLEKIISGIGDDGTDSLGKYFLDWPTRGNEELSRSGTRALLRMALDAGAYLSSVFCERKLSDKCTNARKKLDLVSEGYGDSKQVAAMLSHSGTLAPDKAADIITGGGTNGFSTFMSYYLLSAVADTGRCGEALALMKEYYGTMLEKGATSFFEDYDPVWTNGSGDIVSLPGDKTDIHGDFGAFCYKGFRHSLCHGWASGPVPFLTEYVLGIKVTGEGCREITVKPHLSGLKFAKGTFPTPFGTVNISHELCADGSVKTVVDAPSQVHYRVVSD